MSYWGLRKTALPRGQLYRAFICENVDPVGRVKAILGDPGAVSGGGKQSKRARKKIPVQKCQLHPNFFSRPFRLFSAPTNCPWVSEDELKLTLHDYS